MLFLWEHVYINDWLESRIDQIEIFRSTGWEWRLSRHLLHFYWTHIALYWFYWLFHFPFTFLILRFLFSAHEHIMLLPNLSSFFFNEYTRGKLKLVDFIFVFRISTTSMKWCSDAFIFLIISITNNNGLIHLWLSLKDIETIPISANEMRSIKWILCWIMMMSLLATSFATSCFQIPF